MTTTTRLPCGDVVAGPTTSRPAECPNPAHRTWVYLDRPDHIQRGRQTVAMDQQQYIKNENEKGRRLREFSDFVEERKGWQLNEQSDTSHTGMRVFEYPLGESAALWVEMTLNPHRWPVGFAAHVSVSFSAGPEESLPGRRLQDVTGWLAHKESLLQIPLRIAEAKTYAGALQVACELRNSADLYTISYVFDLNFHETSANKLRYQLVARCAPKLVPKEGGK